MHSLYQILVGMEPAFVIVAFRAWDRWKPWALMAATAAAFTLLCFLRRFLGL